MTTNETAEETQHTKIQKSKQWRQTGLKPSSATCSDTICDLETQYDPLLETQGIIDDEMKTIKLKT